MMNKNMFFRFLNDYKLKRWAVKNTLIYFACVVLPLGIVSGIYYNMSKTNAEQQIINVGENNLQRSANVIDNILHEMSLLSAQVSIDNDVQKSVSYDYKALYKTQEVTSVSMINQINSNVLRKISMFTQVYKYIDSIYIYSEKNSIIMSNTETVNVGEFQDLSWKDDYEKNKSRLNPIIKKRTNSTGYPVYISIIKPIYLNLVEPVGTVVINLNIGESGKLLRNNKDDAYSLFLEDECGNIVPLLDEEKFGQNSQIDYNKIGRPFLKIKGNEYVVNTLESNKLNMKYTSLTPTLHYRDSVKNAVNFSIVFILMSVIIAVFSTVFIISTALKPMRALVVATDDVESWEGNLSKKFDEISYFIGNFIDPIKTKKQMEFELAQRLELLNRTQTAALQGQINPHFMCNTLESIKWMALDLTKFENNNVAETLSILSVIFRYSLDMKIYLVPIEEEVKQTKLYVRIYSLRYGEFFKIAWDLDDGLEEYKILKLCLQPLIENAVYHGIKSKKTGGLIKVSITDKGDVINITISDNGVGIDEQRLNEIKEQLVSDNLFSEDDLGEAHVGLRNTNRRIKLIFGTEYGLSIKSKLGVGTDVQMVIPKIN